MGYLVHGELSYELIGLLYKIYNTMGPGFQEKYYQKAITKVLESKKIPYLEQVKANLEYNGINLGHYYIDFINNKIVLEIKARSFFSKRDIKQVLGYLHKTGLELGILAGFASDGVKFKRILRGH